MGVCTAPRTQYKHVVFPRLRLGAVVFPKVSSRGPCARLSGELWRGWRRLACWMKSHNMCFLWHSSQPCLQLPSHILTHPPYSPPHPPSQEGLPAETGGLILPWSALQLHPSDKALRLLPLSRFLSHSQNWVKPLLLSSVWCLWFSRSNLIEGWAPC